MVRRTLLGIALAASISACHPTQRYQSVGQIVQSEVIEADEKGKPLIHEVEFEWDPCPGDQFQVVRGGTEFAECIAKNHKVGDSVYVEVEHYWDSRGFYRWEMTKIGECPRPPQIDAEGSYEKSQECHDVLHHGQKVGFLCNRKPFKGLVSVCPWMARN